MNVRASRRLETTPAAWVEARPLRALLVTPVDPALGQALTRLPDVDVCDAGRPADVVQADVSALDALVRLRRADVESALVLDLGLVGPSALGRRDARRARCVDLILARSRAGFDDLRRRHPELARRAVVLPQPLDLGLHAPEDDLARVRRTVVKRFRSLHRLAHPTVLFAGPYTRGGGLEHMIEAALDLRARFPDVRLAAVPVGAVDARYLDRCERRALALGHRAPVQWTVAPDELPLWFATASVVCSLAEAPWPTVDWAAAAGRPFVGPADSAGAVRISRDDPAGLRAALAELLDADDEAARLGRLGRADAERRLSYEAVAASLLERWRQVVRGGPRPA